MTAVMQPTGNEVKREGLDDVRRSGRSAHQQRRILTALYWCAADQGLTRQALAEGLGLALASVCGRCKELADLDYIAPIGSVGRPARQVLALTERGADVAQTLLEDAPVTPERRTAQ